MPCVEGQLHQIQKLAIVPQACPPFVVRIKTGLGDCHITETTGVFPYDLSPNRQTVLERALLKQVWQDRLAAHLCRVSTHPVAAAPPVNWARYIELRDRVLQSETEAFVPLTQMAALDLRRDFVGARLLGIDCTESDLSGANLARANLRGATLCDTDLREANLSYATLRGADLSGALMENANLSHVEAQNTSLALANLAGANLTAANLTAANLTNTTWTSAEVTGLQLGQNVGLSPEQKRALQTRGALAQEPL
jgi:hypothetical protein